MRNQSATKRALELADAGIEPGGTAVNDVNQRTTAPDKDLILNEQYKHIKYI